MKDEIRREMNIVIKELENIGIRSDSHSTYSDTKGLGDIIETVLNKCGITEERFKQWFNLKECNCSKRKAWLNNLFSWKVNNK